MLQVCPSTGRPCDCTAGQLASSSQDKQALADLKHVKAPQEPIFPAELRKRPAPELHLPGPLAAWHRYAANVPCPFAGATRPIHCLAQVGLPRCPALAPHLLGSLAAWHKEAFQLSGNMLANPPNECAPSLLPAHALHIVPGMCVVVTKVLWHQGQHSAKIRQEASSCA